MKRFLTTLALTCVLSVSALAGTIDTCGVSEPAPTETQSSAVVTVILTILSVVV
jgi:hypothetical protein